jgi:hypothetical protein
MPFLHHSSTASATKAHMLGPLCSVARPRPLRKLRLLKTETFLTA